MNIQFKAKGVDITSAVQAYAQEKIESLYKFLDTTYSEPRFEVEFSQDAPKKHGEIYRVDIVVTSGKTDMHAVGHGESYQAALDMAKDDLARRLTRAKTKERNILRKGSRMIKKMLRMGE